MIYDSWSSLSAILGPRSGELSGKQESEYKGNRVCPRI